MRALRSQAVKRTAVLVPGLAASFLVLSSGTIAYQDLASYLALRSGADQAWRRHVASLVRPSTTVAGFAFSRPLPLAARQALQAPAETTLASLETIPATLDLNRAGPAPGASLGAGMDRGLIYPLPNREAKGDMLVPRPPLRLSIGSADDPALLAPPSDATALARFERDPERTDTEHSPLSLGGLDQAVPPEAAAHQETAPQETAEAPASETPAATERAGISVTGEGPIASARAGFGAPSVPLESAPFRVTATEEPAPAFAPVLGPFATERSGENRDSLLARLLAGPRQPAANRPPAGTVHPATALALTGEAHARAERCLAEAVYWEARSEPERGQMAVAQVVLNRAVSGFYPRDVCGVVYQNAHRYLSCQFTFACEGRRSLVPTEGEPWSRARTVARDMMASRTWLTDVGHATHYHATYVRPWWARSMNRLQQIGVHVFYRPRNWGAGPQVQAARAPGES